MDTIFALSSGQPPAGIAVIRISGPKAADALTTLAGSLGSPRRVRLAKLRNDAGDLLDDALVLWFPGPRTATGEDLAELHCHGGRAVVASIEAALAAMPGLRKAEAGEFTRRAFANGVIDLAEAEGLGDLLSAETELQRSTAIAMAGGALGRKIAAWTDDVLILSAQVEGVLDFSDEEDAQHLPASFAERLERLLVDIAEWLERPRSDRLAEGFRVVLSGPPNVGKSTLFNALVESEAAITSAVAGTTRDVIERSVAIAGVPFTFVDTAGLREDSGDEIENIGIGRARDQLARADCVLWLGNEGQGPQGAWEIETYIDNPQASTRKKAALFRVSGRDGTNVAHLKNSLVDHARSRLPRPGEIALNARQHYLLSQAHTALENIQSVSDLLIAAEHLRQARMAFDRLIGRASTENMLDTLFGRFCIGK